MTVEHTFLNAIKAAPQDTTTQLIYADWLDEQGDPRGELIRLHVEVRETVCKHPHWTHFLSAIENVYGTSHPSQLPYLLDERQQQLLACQFAESVRHFYEAVYPDDNRIGRAIELVRKAALSKGTRKQFQAAFDAVEAAIRSVWTDGGFVVWDTNPSVSELANRRAMRAALAAQKAIAGALGTETFSAQNAAMHASKTAKNDAGRKTLQAKHLTWIVNCLLGFEGEEE
ncbi:MAG: TIGR02996 domain-containing protein [Planctomycetaceae bacterium]|nr:TIGR02996 domain-containing protein [Planctomycetaceae bacterium]